MAKLETSCAAAHECVKKSGEQQCDAAGYFFLPTPSAPSHSDAAVKIA